MFSISQHEILKAEKNKFDIIGYFTYESDIVHEMKGFLKHISKIVDYVREMQKSEAYRALDLGYFTFINRIIGPGYAAILPLQSMTNPIHLNPYYNKYCIPTKLIFRNDDTVVAVFEKRLKERDNKRIKNVHFSIEHPELLGGTRFLLSGDYEYYHMDEDNETDFGFGHTYRALQTVLSWYKEDNFIKEVPTIKEIQQLLVDAGEKEPDFVNSKETIGAFEVGVILKRLLDVKSLKFSLIVRLRARSYT